ncbi:2Fe-2S iron-sulfur cluster-binding protein [Bdellovibrio sp. HCB-110]|uniref:2Fe-2S iron-sulfur cluster-binding protein n=1 Tax=Bdellovibrio sp. HCB-110 TaxID=3391182 RepID=UPI0039B483EF
MKAKSGIYISFLPDNLDVLVSHKDHCVLDVALRAGIAIDHTCGGNGTCGTCLVQVVEGLEKLEPRNEIEEEMAQDRSFNDQERLACQIKPFNGLSVQIKKES